MGRYELEYPRDAVNTVKRHDERAVYALRRIHDLINSSQILHVSFSPAPDAPFPVILPMIGQMGAYARPSADLGDPLDLYLHGYVSSRLVKRCRAAAVPDASAGAGDDHEKGDPPGLPVCVAASHVDGIVLALSAFSHSYNYRSAVLFGHATLVESDEEKLYAAELITDSVMPQRWQDTRLPPTKAELQSTSILRVKIASGSAKIRRGGVSDDRHDLADERALNRTWTGVVPIYTVAGEPLPAPSNRVNLPAYAAHFIHAFGAENEEHSVAAAKETAE